MVGYVRELDYAAEDRESAAAMRLENENLRATLKLCAAAIETKAPRTMEGEMNKPWDELLERINATLDGARIR